MTGWLLEGDVTGRASKGGGQAMDVGTSGTTPRLAKALNDRFSGALLLPSGIGFRAVGSPKEPAASFFGS
jgi:hypothetical protein